MIILLCQKILIKIWSKRGGPEPSPPPPPHPKKQKKIQIWILCQNSNTRELNIIVVLFVLKKLLTYSEMVIVPCPLHCVGSCIFFVFTSFDTVWHTVLVSVPPTPSSPFPKFLFIRFSVFVKIHLQESSQSCRATTPPTPPTFPKFFYRI